MKVPACLAVLFLLVFAALPGSAGMLGEPITVGIQCCSAPNPTGAGQFFYFWYPTAPNTDTQIVGSAHPLFPDPNNAIDVTDTQIIMQVNGGFAAETFNGTVFNFPTLLVNDCRSRLRRSVSGRLTARGYPSTRTIFT